MQLPQIEEARSTANHERAYSEPETNSPPGCDKIGDFAPSILAEGSFGITSALAFGESDPPCYCGAEAQIKNADQCPCLAQEHPNANFFLWTVVKQDWKEYKPKRNHDPAVQPDRDGAKSNSPVNTHKRGLIEVPSMQLFDKLPPLALAQENAQKRGRCFDFFEGRHSFQRPNRDA
jgi:hypothetical protein